MLRARSVLALGLLSAAALAACEDETIARVEPRLNADPVRVDFGDVVVGTVGRAPVRLSNSGEAVLTILSATPDDVLGGEVTLADVPELLSAGGEVEVSLAFAPTSVGERAGKVVFMTDSGLTREVAVEVVGRGVEPALVADPPVIDFGRVVVGQTRSATVTLTNQGREPLSLIRASLDMGTSVEFLPDLMRQELAPGARTTMVVRYAPTDLGPDEGRVVVIDSSVRPMSLAVRVRGTGVESDIELDPRRLVFTGVYVGQQQTLPFYVRNIGERDHQITELVIESGGTMFTLTATATPFVVRPGTAVQVDVTYRPITAATHTDRVRVASTGLSAPAYVELEGTAADAPVPVIEVTPAAVPFGQVELGQTRTLGVRITNVGNAPLTMNDVSLTGGPYTLVSMITAGQVFAPRDSQEVQITFAPTVVGAAPASELLVRSSDPARPEVRVPLSGEGTTRAAPIIRVVPNPVAFGQVPRGTNASRSVTVHNDGSAPLALNQVRLSNDAMGRFTLGMPPAAGTMVAPGGQLQFSVGYLDNGVVASYTGQLQVLSSDPATPTTNVTLTAATEPPPVQATDIALVLNWTNAPADVDLHLVRPGSTMFNNPGDVCFCNPNPDWGMLNVPTDNPFLDRDDLVGPGPENINLTTAETGDYTVIVHYFSDAGGGPAPSTVRINLRGMLVATETRTLTNNQRWTVGTISWNAATRTGTWRASPLPPYAALIRLCL
jgi:hypothetical protein